MNHAFKKILDLTNNPTRKFSKENVYVTSFFYPNMKDICWERKRKRERNLLRDPSPLAIPPGTLRAGVTFPQNY